MPIPDEISQTERNFPPAHFSLRIESYSLLCNALREKYESGIFDADGYKWKLILYPNGNKKGDGDGHLSLYLAIDQSNHFPNNNWSIRVNFKLFVLNQINKKYLTIQYATGEVKRFDKLTIFWGFDQFISLENFNDPSNGYLVNDCCTFGAEVYIVEPSSSKEEIISMVKKPTGGIFTWPVQDFTKLNDSLQSSKQFTVGDRQWTLWLYPRGHGSAKRKDLSLYLKLADWESFSPRRSVYAEFTLRVLDHRGIRNAEKTAQYWFDTFNGKGFQNFMPLGQIYEFSNGYIKGDKLIVQVEFLILSVVKDGKEAEPEPDLE